MLAAGGPSPGCGVGSAQLGQGRADVFDSDCHASQGNLILGLGLRAAYGPPVKILNSAPLRCIQRSQGVLPLRPGVPHQQGIDQGTKMGHLCGSCNAVAYQRRILKVNCDLVHL